VSTRALCLAAVLAAACACKNHNVTSQQQQPRVVLHKSDGGEMAIHVELARSGPEQARGLMFRDWLAADAGMLFIFDRPQPLSFWMKNTFIPLDMIFIDADRRIVGIVENAEPRTTSSRGVPGDSLYVLEINGGLSARLGLRPGLPVEFRDIP